MRTIANTKNLKRGNPETQFKAGREQVEIARKGGIASGKARGLRSFAKQLANGSLTEAEKRKFEKKYGLTDNEEGSLNNNTKVAISVFTSACNGDMKAVEKWQELTDDGRDNDKERKWTIPIDNITSDYVEVYRAVHKAFDRKEDIKEIINKGGRGSVKSTFWHDLAYETILQDDQAHVVFSRRFKVDLRGSVYNQFRKTVIKNEGCEDNWDFKQSPLCAVYKPTGQTVMFVGADKPVSLKSFTVTFGYVKLLIHEECDEMAGIEQMDNIEDTFLRSDTPALDVKVFNPPKSKNNFMNEYTEKCRNKECTRVFHSYYYNVPLEWLGKRFFERAEWFKIHKPLYYRNNYLGEVTGTGGGIFDNLEIREISDAEIETFGIINHGLDFGFSHPQTFCRNHYDDEEDVLYIFDEVWSKKCKNSSFARKIKKYMDKEIICDSARPDAIAEMQDWGFNAIGAKKRWGTGKGRDYCWEWMQQCTKIVIDPVRCPHTSSEFSKAEHEQLADGSFSDAYPTLEEDTIMANIYSLNRIIMESRRNDGLYDDGSDDDADYEEEED